MFMKIQALKPSLKGFFSLVAIAATANLVGYPVTAQTGGSSIPASPSRVQPDSPAAPAVPTAPISDPGATPGTTPGTAPETTPGTTTTPGATPDGATQPDTSPQSTTRPSTGTSSAASNKTIAEIAASNGSFKTLAKAVKAAGLSTALSGKGPYTVFAPTDEAFAALPKGTLQALLKPENKEKLRKILAYHVLAGEVDSSTLKAGQVPTVEGSPVNVSVSNGEVMVNDARVTTPDIKAKNGVIHVINKVILPPDM
jgi:uncharacterized surface protein with fasciclin (FAS1) repeats